MKPAKIVPIIRVNIQIVVIQIAVIALLVQKKMLVIKIATTGPMGHVTITILHTPKSAQN